MTNSSPQRHESASAPALNHRHPFLQARRQPHQHGPSSEANASALDVTAAEKRAHQHHDIEQAAGVAPSPPASVAVVPAPGDPAHPLTDGESHENDDEVGGIELRKREGAREAAKERDERDAS